MNWLDRGAVATGLRLAAIHAREPAAWIAAATATLPLVWLCGGGGVSRRWLVVPVAIACGGLATVASLGDPPGGLPDGRRQPWLPLWLARAAWPLAAGLAAMLVVGSCGGVDLLLAGIGAGGCLLGGAAALASMVLVVVARRGAATAASGGLVVVAATAGVAIGAGLLDATAGGQLAAAVGAGAVMAVSWLVAGREAAAGFGGSEPALPTLRAVAMVTTLATMVVCLFLAAHLAAGYVLLVVGWFVALAVPAATSGSGSPAASWLGRSAVGRPALPGTASLARSAAIDHAVLLGWPAIVALALPPVAGPRAVSPWLAIGCLAAGAAVLMAAVSLCGRRGPTPRAIALAAAAAAAVGGAAWP